MEILNIGPLELIMFLVIAFVLLGPKGMVLTAYKIGQWIRQAVRSPMWKEILRSAQDIRDLPTKLMEETGLEEDLKAIKADTQAAVNEVNTSLKEAKEAARVPEAEHMRLGDSAVVPTIAPAKATVPAAVLTEYPAPLVDENVEETSEPGEQPHEAAAATVVTVDQNNAIVAETTPSVVDDPAQENLAPAGQPAVEAELIEPLIPIEASPTEPVTFTDVSTASPIPQNGANNSHTEVPAEVVKSDGEIQTEKEKPARKRTPRKKAETAEGTGPEAVPVEIKTGENSSPGADVETIQPTRKRASRKKSSEAAAHENGADHTALQAEQPVEVEEISTPEANQE